MRDAVIVTRDETVRRTLGKNQVKPWQKQHWCLLAMDAAFVAPMEDVLDLYAQAPDRPGPALWSASTRSRCSS